MLSRFQVIPASVVPWILLVLVALVAPGGMARADGEPSDVGLIRTAKERLGVKASDKQRVDNCKVPIELRGAKSRPDECGDGASTTMFVNCGPSTAQPVAVFNFELIDTSLEGAVRGARPDEQERLARMSDQLREMLRDSCRFSLVDGHCFLATPSNPPPSSRAAAHVHPAARPRARPPTIVQTKVRCRCRRLEILNRD
jgi:ribosomal protein L27